MNIIDYFGIDNRRQREIQVHVHAWFDMSRVTFDQLLSTKTLQNVLKR